MIAMLFRGIQNDPLFIAAFKAVKPASVALILVPVFSIAKRTGVVGFKFLIPVMIALLITFTPLSPIYVILASIAGGILYYGCKKNDIHTAVLYVFYNRSVQLWWRIRYAAFDSKRSCQPP